MAKIFISYRRRYDGFLVLNLSEKLRNHFGKDSVFLDIDNIPLGADFVKHIGNEVGQCDILLAIISEQWSGATDKQGNRRLEQEGDYVRIEIEAALKRDIPVIPVLVDEAFMPPAADLPATIQSIVRRNAIKIRADSEFHQYIERLIRGLEVHFKTKENPKSETPAKESAPKPKTRARRKEKPKPKEPETQPAVTKAVEPAAPPQEARETPEPAATQPVILKAPQDNQEPEITVEPPPEARKRSAAPAPKKEPRAATEKQGKLEKEEARQIIVKGLGGISSAQLFLGQIPSSKLKNAINSYAPNIAAQNVLLLYDNTVFGGAKQGLLLTHKAVHWQDAWGGNAGTMRFSDIKTVTSEADGTGGKIFINDCAIQINQGDHTKLVKVLTKVLLDLKARARGRTTEGPAAKTAVISDDDSCQLSIPGNWMRQTGVNSVVTLHVVDLVKDIAVIVVRESKSDFSASIDLDAFVELVCNTVRNTHKDTRFSEFTPTTIGGFSARQFDVSGTSNTSLAMKYLFACVETPQNYYQLKGGTLVEKYQENRAEFLDIINSFKEI